MSETVLQQFKSVTDKVNSEEITVKEGANQIACLDFNSLSLDEIEVVEDSDWIPDHLYAKIIRSWIKNQERNINQVIAYLTMSNSVGKEQMISFVDAIFKPKNSLSLEVENVIEKIATGGGNRPYTNPISLGLIKASSDDEMPAEFMKLANLFSGDRSKKFQSKPKPKAGFKFDLPPYMKLIPKSYKIGIPEQTKGPKSWVLQAKSDQDSWVNIAMEKNCTDYHSKGGELSFQIAQKDNNAYSSFQFINLEMTNDNNHSLILSSFDISGVVILKSNRRY